MSTIQQSRFVSKTIYYDDFKPITIEPYVQNLAKVDSIQDAENRLFLLHQTLSKIIEYSRKKYISHLKEILAEVDLLGNKMIAAVEKHHRTTDSGMIQNEKRDPEVGKSTDFLKTYKIPRRSSTTSVSMASQRSPSSLSPSANVSSTLPSSKKLKRESPPDWLLEKMQCTHCKRNLIPNQAYKCINDHLFCMTCKGSKPYGPECRECKEQFNLKRKIRPSPVTADTNSCIKMSSKYVRKCPECKKLYYKFGLEEHRRDCMVGQSEQSRNIEEMWNLEAEHWPQ